MIISGFVAIGVIFGIGTKATEAKGCLFSSLKGNL